MRRLRKFFCTLLVHGEAFELTANEWKPKPPGIVLSSGRVTANETICREHFRMKLVVDSFPEATAGQFVHLGPVHDSAEAKIHEVGTGPRASLLEGGASWSPFLRRAYSIAGLKRHGGVARIDVIYRVTGLFTTWLASRSSGDPVSVLGPLGNSFPILRDKPRAWLVAGGVGLPPLLWLAEALHQAGKKCVAFCGARTFDLLPLTFAPEAAKPTGDRAVPVRAAELSSFDTPVVVSTDDGSAGFGGHVVAALNSYFKASGLEGCTVTGYTCGPEAMMRSVAAWCHDCGVSCYVCVERNMACGLGTCQSCAVPIRDAAGWSYRLCCSDGPIFQAGDVLWDPPDASAAPG